MLKRALMIMMGLLIAMPLSLADAMDIGEAENTLKKALSDISKQNKDISKSHVDHLLNRYIEELTTYQLTEEEMKLVIPKVISTLQFRSEDIPTDSEGFVTINLEIIVASVRDELAIKKFTYQADKPSEWARARVSEMMLAGELPEAYQRNFQKPITVGELAQLYFGDETSYDELEISEASITADTPSYVKSAFLYGLIDSTDELGLTMTREEAALRIDKSLTYTLGNYIDVKDYMSITPTAHYAVANSLAYSVMESLNGNFEPKKPFTKEQAIVGKSRYSARNIRGIIPTNQAIRDAHLTVGRNYALIDFPSTEAAREYIKYYIEPYMKSVKLTGKNQRIDVGYAIIELWGSEQEVKVTLKNNVQNVEFFSSSGTVMMGIGVYSEFGREGYLSEPRELKPQEKMKLEFEPDSITKKLNSKIDPILKKIITPKMTAEQKVKAIHDYVIQKITYSSGTDYISSENALEALETGRGVCVHYTSLFHYMATRAGITTVPLQGNSIVGAHAWNAVYLNGKWKFLDTTLDDNKTGKINYTYYLKDASYMMNTHEWPGFGYLNPNHYAKVDGMKIRSTEELRIYLLQIGNSEAGFPKTITFRTKNKGVNTDIRFLNIRHGDGDYLLRYDAKKDLYVMTKKH